MTTNTKQVDFTKPFQVSHFNYENTHFTCTPIGDSNCNVSWPNGSVTYTLKTVEGLVQKGIWIPLPNENTQQEDAMKKLEDYIKAINKNVPEATTEQPEGCAWCECPDCKEAFTSVNEPCFFCSSTAGCECEEFIEVPEQDLTCYICHDNISKCDCGKCGTDYDMPQETLLDADADNLLDAIKSFTLSTGASVSINEGAYEVYWAGFDNPFKADNDHDMINLMESINVLDGAL